MKFVAGGLTSVFALVVFLGAPRAGEKKDPKHSISEVMVLAHKKGLLQRVITGKANEEDKQQLVELYVSLAQNEPPKGEAKAWKKRTEEIVRLAKAAAKGDAKAPPLLKKAADCASCHKIFRG